MTLYSVYIGEKSIRFWFDFFLPSFLATLYLSIFNGYWRVSEVKEGGNWRRRHPLSYGDRSTPNIDRHTTPKSFCWVLLFCSVFSLLLPNSVPPVDISIPSGSSSSSKRVFDFLGLFLKFLKQFDIFPFFCVVAGHHQIGNDPFFYYIFTGSPQ